MPEPSDHDAMVISPEMKSKEFERAFEKYWKQLYHHALRKLNDQEIAEDLVQESFVVLWNNEQMLMNLDLIQGYLYGILRHKILDVFRKDEVRLRYANGFSKQSPIFASAADEQMIANELQKIIDDELSLMPARMVEIYHLKRDQKLTTAQIAT